MYTVEQQGAELLNEAISLRVENGCGADSRTLLHLLEASKHRQIIIVKSEKGELLASIAYAKISKYTLKLILNEPEKSLYPYEYQEGKILFVLDYFFKKGHFRQSLALATPPLNRYRIISYVKKGRMRALYNRRGVFTSIKTNEHKLHLDKA